MVPSADFHCIDLPRGERKLLPLRGDVGEIAGREVIHRRHQHLGEAVRRGARPGQHAMVVGEGRIREMELGGTADALHLARGRIHAEDVCIGFLQGGEVNAVRAPVEQVRVFVERVVRIVGAPPATGTTAMRRFV